MEPMRTGAYSIWIVCVCCAGACNWLLLCAASRARIPAWIVEMGCVWTNKLSCLLPLDSFPPARRSINSTIYTKYLYVEYQKCVSYVGWCMDEAASGKFVYF